MERSKYCWVSRIGFLCKGPKDELYKTIFQDYKRNSYCILFH